VHFSWSITMTQLCELQSAGEDASICCLARLAKPEAAPTANIFKKPRRGIEKVFGIL
jgi:hypothetical protein